MNSRCSTLCSPRCWIITAAVLIYFILFPEDLEQVLAPVRILLEVTTSVSPWAYGLLAVVVVCLTALRIAGGRTRPPV